MTEVRLSFIDEHQEELSNENLFTLCERHHDQLHNIYGQRYSNRIVPKVLRWVEIQRNKFLDKG